MAIVAINPDRWNCPYLKIECNASEKVEDFKLFEQCEVRNYSECLLVNGDRCERFEEYIKERENEGKGL